MPYYLSLSPDLPVVRSWTLQNLNDSFLWLFWAPRGRGEVDRGLNLMLAMPSRRNFIIAAARSCTVDSTNKNKATDPRISLHKNIRFWNCKNVIKMIGLYVRIYPEGELNDQVPVSELPNVV